MEGAWGGGGGNTVSEPLEGARGARLSDFFLQRIQIKKKIIFLFFFFVFFLGGGWGVGGGIQLVNLCFYYESKGKKIFFLGGGGGGGGGEGGGRDRRTDEQAQTNLPLGDITTHKCTSYGPDKLKI